MVLKKMCMMCMILSPNCCAVTIFEYSTTDVTLPSCLSVAREHVASQSKWQSADLDLLKLAKKRNGCGQRYSEVMCSFRPIKFQRQCHFRSEVYSRVESEPKHEVATIEREFKLLFCFWVL